MKRTAAKKKNRFSKFIVMLVIALNITFTLAVLYICKLGYTVPDSLIASWFAFTTAELWGLSKIQRDKVKKEGSEKINDYGPNNG